MTLLSDLLAIIPSFYNMDAFFFLSYTLARVILRATALLETRQLARTKGSDWHGS